MTNDGSLSQEEIDALLAIGSEDLSDEDHQTDDIHHYLSPLEIDAIGEIGNISIGSSATTLSTLLNQQVRITTPRVSVVKKPELFNESTENHVHIKVDYVEGFNGESVFVIQSEDAAIISDIMLGGDGTSPDMSLTDMHLSAVQEVMNQMMGAAATSMSTIFEKRVNISPPMITSVENEEKSKFVAEIDEEVFVKVSFQLEVGTLIDSSIMQLIPFPFAYELVEELLDITNVGHVNELEPALQAQIEFKGGQEEPINHLPEDNEAPSEQPGLVNDQRQSSQLMGRQGDMGDVTVQQATFSEFEEVELTKHEHRNLDMLLDIPLKVTVELGRTNRPIHEILDLSAGSIVELDKLAGEPVDILVNEKLIAKGEVVVIDENFGVRVTDIVNKSERIKSLK